MKLFKKFIKNYLFFGLGLMFGSAIGTVITYFILVAAYGMPDSENFFKIQRCLEEKYNE
tara:strand:- start:93 stop:269 length:177 start_codon:yes stop_codon:yes gene_type:complete